MWNAVHVIGACMERLRSCVISYYLIINLIGMHGSRCMALGAYSAWVLLARQCLANLLEALCEVCS